MNERQQHGLELATRILKDYEGVVDETALEYLLTDLMHWCDARQSDFNALLQLARKRHHEDREETA